MPGRWKDKKPSSMQNYFHNPFLAIKINLNILCLNSYETFFSRDVKKVVTKQWDSRKNAESFLKQISIGIQNCTRFQISGTKMALSKRFSWALGQITVTKMTCEVMMIHEEFNFPRGKEERNLPRGNFWHFAGCEIAEARFGGDTVWTNTSKAAAVQMLSPISH